MLERTQKTLAGCPPILQQECDLVHRGAGWSESEPMSAWQSLRAITQSYPPLLAGAILWDGWEIYPSLQDRGWLGNLLVAAELRARKKTRAHLLCLNAALRNIRMERRRLRDQTARLIAFLEAIALAAESGGKDHDRWLLAKAQLERRLVGRRSSSRLPALVDLVMARPLVTSEIIAKELGVSQRAAQDMGRQLGLREITGRGRYQAWGIL
jgi:hypothetical protein